MPARIGRRAFLVGLGATALLSSLPRSAAGEECLSAKALWQSEDLGTGDYLSPPITHTFREAIPSWEAETPPGTWIEVDLRGRTDGAWSDWAKLGRWHTDAAGIRRGSFSGQPDVQTDTLVLDRPAEAIQARIGLFGHGDARPRVRALALALSDKQDRPGLVSPLGLASDLDVPGRSQMVFPDGGRVWCSPTSTSMVMAYWARLLRQSELEQSVPEVVRGVWDHGAGRSGIGGNWPFNTAYAASFGLRARVARLASLVEVEPWTAAGVPVVASIRFRGGELSGSPIWSALGGHLLVIRGFTPSGDVLVNDPAASSDAAVARRYDRFELEKAWLRGSNGVVYLIHPPDWAVPRLPGVCA